MGGLRYPPAMSRHPAAATPGSESDRRPGRGQLPGPEERLEPVASRSRSRALQDTAVRIGLAVNLGLLGPNERLPTEDDLAATFGVSPATVRRALQLLADRGVVVRRRGRLGGTFVAPDPPRQVLSEFEAYRASSGEVFELIDYRLVLESGTASLAAGRATAADVDRLRQLVRAMDEAESWIAFRRVDPRFHLEVATIAGSTAATRALAETLGRLFRFYVPYPMTYLRGSNREHAALVDAIAAHDRAGAVAVIEGHIRELYGTVFVSPDLDGGGEGERS